MPLPSSSCSAMWDDARVPAWGTASHADFWVALEQPGPWGRIAFDGSRLDPAIGLALEAACADAGGRALLIRPPAVRREGPADPEPQVRRVYVSGGMVQGTPWLLTGLVTDPADVLALPWGAVAAGEAEAVLAGATWLGHTEIGVALVCAHSKRDVCCAVRGRPVARDADLARPGRVWECSHTGGHRFAPTGILLPHGTTLGRVEAEELVAALDAAQDGRLPVTLDIPRQLRGMSELWPIEQAAQACVRAHAGVLELTGLGARIVRETDEAAYVRVAHADGRTWAVRVAVVDDGPARRGSCGGALLPSTGYAAQVLRED